MDLLVLTLQSGLASLASYLAAHVLLCLVPAVFFAGALSAKSPVVGTPALVIHNEVKVAGRMPSREELAGWLRGDTR
jgi:hypothetical protein